MNDSYRYHLPSEVTDPAEIKLSYKKWLFWFFDMGTNYWFKCCRMFPLGMLKEHIMYGDSWAAVVIQGYPELRIAAYSDEIDGIVMLNALPSVSKTLIKKYKLEVGTRLLTTNTYVDMLPLSDNTPFDRDIIIGENQTLHYYEENPSIPYCWHGMHPIIAEFISADYKEIEARKSVISDLEWKRAESLGKAYLRQFPSRYRYCNPYLSFFPSKN
ncbi:MAG: hypothetical protein R3D71_08770 [Rickettsiales bacterium]